MNILIMPIDMWKDYYYKYLNAKSGKERRNLIKEYQKKLYENI
jgi:hypothetical protein